MASRVEESVAAAVTPNILLTSEEWLTPEYEDALTGVQAEVITGTSQGVGAIGAEKAVVTELAVNPSPHVGVKAPSAGLNLRSQSPDVTERAKAVSESDPR